MLASGVDVSNCLFFLWGLYICQFVYSSAALLERKRVRAIVLE